MKWLWAILATCLIAYVVYGVYRNGLIRGRREGVSIAPAIAAAARYDAIDEAGRVFGQLETWDGMTRDEFQKTIADQSKGHFAQLQATFVKLEDRQREVILHEFFGTLNDEDEKTLRSIPPFAPAR